MATIVVGFHAIEALLKTNNKRCQRLWCVSSRDDKRLKALCASAEAVGVPVGRIKIDELENKFPHADAHQGVILEVLKAEVFDTSYLLTKAESLVDSSKSATILVLDEVQDPRNLGACLRSAAAYSVDAVVVAKNRSAPLTEIAEKVSCGGSALVPVVAVTNITRTLQSLQSIGFWVVGTSLETDLTLSDVDLTGHIVLVMGREGEGIRQLTAKNCDFLAKIPMTGEIASLNVSAATTVCLYEQARQKMA